MPVHKMREAYASAEGRRPPFLWIGAGIFGAGVVGFLVFEREWILIAGIALGIITFIADRIMPNP